MALFLFYILVVIVYRKYWVEAHIEWRKKMAQILQNYKVKCFQLSAFSIQSETKYYAPCNICIFLKNVKSDCPVGFFLQTLHDNFGHNCWLTLSFLRIMILKISLSFPHVKSENCICTFSNLKKPLSSVFSKTQLLPYWSSAAKTNITNFVIILTNSHRLLTGLDVM